MMRALAARLVIAPMAPPHSCAQPVGINSREHSYEAIWRGRHFNCETAHNATAFQWFSNQGVLALLPLRASAFARSGRAAGAGATVGGLRGDA